MMVRLVFQLWRNERGAAAVEMALITPLLVTLMFGSFELGNYFLSEHVVVKAVRDGARYASRQPFASLPCSSLTPVAVVTTSGVGQNIDHLVRYGKLNAVAGTDKERLAGWASATLVSVKCAPPATYSGIYKGKESNVAVVIVSASTSYQSLFKRLGFTSTSLTLQATSEAAVMGI
jgi:TadE-like protein